MCILGWNEHVERPSTVDTYAYYGLGARDYGTDRKSRDLGKCPMNRAPSVVGQIANTRYFAKVAMEEGASGECCEDLEDFIFRFRWSGGEL